MSFQWPLDRLTIVAGPCSLEDHGLHEEGVSELEAIQHTDERIAIVFKGSFDKANRTSGRALRGVGLPRGIALLNQLYGRIPLMTDFHLPEQAAQLVEVVDVLQVPAALCRQTDMIWMAAKTGLAVNFKKGQWVSPREMYGAVDKWVEKMSMNPRWDYTVQRATPIAITERGSFFGYGDVVADMRNIPRLQRGTANVAVLFDASHTVQRPGLRDGQSGGEPEFIANLARAGVAAGANGVFIETHPEPKRATSDGQCMLSLVELGPLVQTLADIWDAVPHNKPME